MKFYLGTHIVNWLWTDKTSHPIFISNRQLRKYKTLKPAQTTWSLDSGGFTELNMYGKWETTPTTYIADIHRYTQEIGQLDWAAPQDWMCEPQVLKKTGKTIQEHQKLTVENWITLKNLAPDLPIIPALQGWQPDDYLRHRDLYATYGIDLTQQPTVGMGTFCRRASLRPVHKLVWQLHNDGIKMHGFGVKSDGLPQIGHLLQSSDSLAWSYTARFGTGVRCGTSHKAKNCANCHIWANQWANKTISKIATNPYEHQPELDLR